MKRDWFSPKYRIMPVYSDTSNNQVAVMVEIKETFLHEFQPMMKTCIDENGELHLKPAIFDNEEDAKFFLDHLTEMV